MWAQWGLCNWKKTKTLLNTSEGTEFRGPWMEALAEKRGEATSEVDLSNN